MGLFDIFKKKKTAIDPESVAAYELGKSIKELPFKTNQGAYEYTKKYFSDAILMKKSLVHGLVFVVQPEMAFVRCTFKIDGKKEEILVAAGIEDKRLKNQIIGNDFVEVGILDIGKVLKFSDFVKGFNKNPKDMISLTKDITLGTVVHKLSRIFHIKSGQFKAL